jgi:tetratricopeptide (TPR) repeat protein
LKPDFYWSHFNRAKVLIAVGRKEDAIRDYEYLLKRDPRNQEIRNLVNGLRAEIATQPVPNLPSLLRSLPSGVQKEIEGIRQSCTESEGTKGDEGLITFTVSGAQAVLVDELNFCGGGTVCMHGVNCATGYTHLVEIYVRSGSTWAKAFSKYVTEPVFLSTEYGEFKALVLKVHAGDKECPSTSSDPTEWKRRSCDFVVRWDNRSKKFTYRPL